MSLLFKRGKRASKRLTTAQILNLAVDRILTDKMYLDPGLRCIDVARAISTNRTYLWDALRTRGMGFQEFLSRYRLRYFILNAAEFQELTCMEIAERCGFNDAKSLNRYLQQMFGITLSDYMKKVSKGL